jgi:hypothetical protein
MSGLIKGRCHEIWNNEDIGQQHDQPHHHNHRLGHNIRTKKGAVSRDLGQTTSTPVSSMINPIITTTVQNVRPYKEAVSRELKH